MLNKYFVVFKVKNGEKNVESPKMIWLFIDFDFKIPSSHTIFRRTQNFVEQI